MNWLDALSGSKPDSPSAPGGNKPIPAPGAAQPGTRPGDDFSVRADWADILLPLGAELHHEASGGVRYWTRPGKDRRNGYSATTGYADDADRLKVFTSSWPPFADGEVYTKFAAYALVTFGGDYQAAARELGRTGYGSQQPAPVSSPAAPPGDDEVPWPAPARRSDPPEMGPHPADAERSGTQGDVPAKDTTGAHLDAIPEYPTWVLAGPLRDLVDWGIRDGFQPEAIGAAGLLTLATLTGPAHLEVSEDRTIRAHIWVPLIGESGKGKSPAIERAAAPILEMQRNQRKQYSDQLREWKKNGKESDPPVKPQLLIITDATMEALGRWLNRRYEDAEDPSGAVISNELAKTLRSLGEYKRGGGSDAEKWLELWDGKDLQIMRVGSGGTDNEVDIFVPEPVVCLGGPLTMNNIALLGEQGGGFRPRWLPHVISGKHRWLRAGKVPESWTSCVNTLLMNRSSREWKLTGASLDAWESARRRWEIQQDDPEPEDVIEALRKADQQALRVALVISESIHPGQGSELPVQAMTVAIAIVDYSISCWRAFIGGPSLALTRLDATLTPAVSALAIWLEGRPEKKARKREIQRARVGGARVPKAVDALIGEYEQTFPGSVREESVPQGGGVSVVVYAPRRDAQSNPERSNDPPGTEGVTTGDTPRQTGGPGNRESGNAQVKNIRRPEDDPERVSPVLMVTPNGDTPPGDTHAVTEGDSSPGARPLRLIPSKPCDTPGCGQPGHPYPCGHRCDEHRPGAHKRNEAS
jgi:hypothetical protein